MHRKHLEKLLSLVLCAALCVGGAPVYAASGPSSGTGATVEETAAEQPAAEADDTGGEKEKGQDTVRFEEKKAAEPSKEEAAAGKDEEKKAVPVKEDGGETEKKNIVETGESTSTGKVTVIDGVTGREIPREMVSFSRPASYENGGYIFDGASAGDTVDYTVSGGDYVTVSGSFTLGSYDFTVEADLIEKADIGGEKVDISKTYGDGAFDIRSYIDIPSDYSGKVSFEVVSGEDVVKTDNDGRTQITAAGDAEVRVVFGAAGKYRQKEMTARIHADRYRLGAVSASDISWDSLEVNYSSEGVYTITGKISGIMDDVITVEANVRPEKNSVGTKKTSVVSAEFDGDKDYDLSLDGQGPQITVTGRSRPALRAGNRSEVSVRASYDVNGPENGKYFNRNRTLTVEVTDPPFNEDLLALSITVNGAARTLADIRSGTDGAVLVMDGEKDEGTGKVKYAVEFGGDEVENTYTVAVSYDGRQAQPEGDAAEEFVIDNVAPAVAVSYMKPDGSMAEPGTDPAFPYYSTGWVTAELTVTDAGFYAGGVTAAVTAQDSKETDISASVYPESSADKVKTEEWNDSGSNRHSFVMDPFMKDANYSLAVSCSDLAGNEAAVYEPHYLTIDSTPPGGKILVTTADGSRKDYDRVLTEKEQSEGMIDYIFDVFSKTVKLEDGSEDATSGIGTVQYCLLDADRAAGHEFRQKADFESIEWLDYKEGVTVDTDRIAVILEKVTDRAGNTAYLSSGGGIIVDTKEPGAPVVTISGSSTGIHGGDVVFDVTASDPDNGGEGVFSGMKKLIYEVTDPATGETRVIGEKEEKKSRVREMSDTVTVPADGNNGNGLVFTVTAEDYAGNIKKEQKILSIDTQAPEVSISLDSSGARNGHYFKEPPLLTVTIRERNYDGADTYLSFTKDGQPVRLPMSDIADGKAEGYAVTLAGITDSEEGVPETEHTDDRTVTCMVLLGDAPGIDTDYSSISVSSTDLAGNRASAVYEGHKTVTVDRAAPVLSFRYRESSEDITQMVTGAEDAPYYTNGEVLAEVNVKERNFSADGLDVDVSQKDGDGNDVSVYSGGGTDDPDRWSFDGSSHSCVMDAFTEDANYGISAGYTDLAGNVAQTYGRHYFTIDRTAPTGSIIVDSSDGSGTYSSLSQQAVFRFISSRAVVLTRQAHDATSGIASVRYYRYTPPVGAAGRFSVPALSDLRDADWKDWKEGTPVTVQPDSQAVIYARIADRAGNVLYINTEGAMIADRTSPARPVISIGVKEPAGGIFNRDVPVTYSAEERVSGGTYAGLRRVSVQVMNGGTATQTDGVEFGDKSARKKTAVGSFTVDAKKNNSNSVSIIVTAEDYAGNVSSAEKTIAIDVTAPRIEVSYDENSPVNGRYYNKTRTAVIRVYERNFDPSGASLAITSSLGAGAKVSGWTIGGNAGVSDDNVNTCTVTYDQDSDYTFTMSVTDRAGNRADYGRTDSFTIDKTAPEFSVSYDVNRDGRYYNTARTAVITVKERNFDPAQFTGMIHASLDGEGIDAPSVSGWSGSGEYHTASVEFSDDGDYSFELDDTDLAGNRAQRYASGLFTIDRTMPEVSFEGVEADSANRGDLSPLVKFFDRNLDDGDAKVYLEGYRHRKREVTGEISGSDGVVSIGDFEHIIENDDVYTLTAEVTDLAGNRTTKSVTFSVNRFGSNYYFDDDTSKFLTSYYHRNGAWLVIYEVNVDTLVNNGITVVHNGVSRVLSEDEYEVTDISEDGDWKKYMYVLSSALFREEGIYEVIIDSADQAGNLQNNKLKDAPVTFVVDMTAPGVVITGIENNTMYNETSRDIVLSVTDNYAADRAELIIDGEVVKEFDAQALEEADNKPVYTIKEGKDWVRISAKAYDAAGNEAESDTYRVFLTTSLFQRLKNSRALPVSGIIILAAVLAAIIFRRRQGRG